jgi:hypothetical protein
MGGMRMARPRRSHDIVASDIGASDIGVRNERGCENQPLRPQPQGQLNRCRLMPTAGRAEARTLGRDRCAAAERVFLRTSASAAPGEGRNSKISMETNL